MAEPYASKRPNEEVPTLPLLAATWATPTAKTVSLTQNLTVTLGIVVARLVAVTLLDADTPAVPGTSNSAWA